MRRIIKYLIITSTAIIVLMSFSLFYFNDSLLMDSIGHYPAHLGASKMGRRQNIVHTSVKSKNDVLVQSNKRLSVDHADGEIIDPQAARGKYDSNIKESINPMVEPDHETFRDRKDALMQKGRNISSMNGNRVLNSEFSANASNAVGHGLNHNINADKPYQVMNGHGGQSVVAEKRVKGHPSSNHMRQSRPMSPPKTQQLSKQDSYAHNNNYLLSKLCSDPLCTNFLSERDLGNFTACRRRTQAAYSKRSAKTAKAAQALSSNQPAPRFSECRFMNGSGRSPVGLVSFPGSGNTWVRGLLQKATGICTGAVYCDRMLRMGGFDGEGVQSGTVLVVKTHSSTPMWTKVRGQLEFNAKGRPFFDSVVLVVRNPFHAMISEWNRELSTKYGLGQGNGTAHTNVYGREYFQTYSRWTKFVEGQTKHWKCYFDWLLKRPADRDIILVRYEDLKKDLLHEIERILTFLHFPYTYTELSARLNQDFSLFHRPKKPKFDHFTTKQEELVNTAIKDVSQQLYDTFGTTYNIEEYISTHQ